ncbi:MAG: 16S rRNA (cytidine(1402)-2'-O)-methyltransferase [Boseongicola sp. SB0664_bin_43]|uniref:Ribosomal RNA small subunit methyltransferase I n=1 Tax=Boseongicola sp. SB0664_bin_43 TaxID=2604844 RepID=A0A6B0XWQ1_9RHOB|nr:16S rRNA (cytidine(1402)-2'-O)-methyltransferase [Boseongicola sp. SB0664_bin_43]
MQKYGPSKSRNSAASKATGGGSLDAGLHLVSTPLGNARDITLRALDVLRDADLLVAEDTRSLRRLMNIHGIPLAGRRIMAYHDHSGDRDRKAVLDALRQNASVAYASEAGTPLVADPGYALARTVIGEGYRVLPVPGPSALIAALTVAGLPCDRFAFAGFPPSQRMARRRFLEALADVRGTLVLYESPRRTSATLQDAADVLGADRPAAMCRELTKKFEEIRRDALGTLAESLAETPLKGEVVLLIGSRETPPDPAKVEQALREALKTRTLRDAASDVASRFGLSRRDIYQLGIKIGK